MGNAESGAFGMEPALKFTGFMLSSKKIIAGITFPVCPRPEGGKTPRHLDASVGPRNGLERSRPGGKSEDGDAQGDVQPCQPDFLAAQPFPLRRVTFAAFQQHGGALQRRGYDVL